MALGCAQLIESLISKPLDSLEIRALQRRNLVHGTKEKVEEARGTLDAKSNIRTHLLGASLVVSAVGFLSGYGLAALFTSDSNC